MVVRGAACAAELPAVAGDAVGAGTQLGHRQCRELAQLGAQLPVAAAARRRIGGLHQQGVPQAQHVAPGQGGGHRAVGAMSVAALCG